MFNLDSVLDKELTELKRHGLFRSMKRIDATNGPTVVIDNKEVILLSSNNYLGLANHPEVKEAQIQAVKEFGASSGASRLISGNMSLHEELEEKIAKFKGTECAIVFSTGYMANLGVISALVGEKGLIVCDKLNHARIIDGARLSSAILRVYPHKNLERLEDILKKGASYKRKLVITDGIFSMDGDIAPLPELVKICQRYDAMLMLDDAHATGVLGEKGKGTCEYFGIEEGIDIQMGTFSKAFGNLGGYVAGSRTLIDYLRNKARSFIYSTALPPAVVAGSIKAVEIIERDASLRERLWSNVRRFSDALIEMGFDTMGTKTQIIPVWIGEAGLAMKTSEILLKNNIFAPGIRPPTVAKSKCRIRTSLMATHTEEHMDKVISVFRRIKNEGLFYNRN